MSTQININSFYQTAITNITKYFAQASSLNTTLNITTANAPQELAVASSLLLPNNGFTLTGAQFSLVYTGTTTQTFKYNVSLNGTTALINNTVTLFISHNGNVTQGTLPYGSFNSSGFETGTAPCMVLGFVTLAPTDTVQIAVAASLVDTLTITSAAIALDQV
jgi:hypothetical protein